MKSKLLLTLIFLVGLSAYAFSQVTVSGTVTDNSGSPLPGVNVIEKGTSNGVATDANGKFSLNVSNGSTLLFSFVGFQPREVKVVGGATDLGTIKMAEEGSLNEVVVTALGVEQSKDQTGSTVTQVSPKALVSSGEPQLLNQLAGKAAGVQIISSSGSDPGAGAKIQIRGANTIGGSNQPLFVIDGIPAYNSTTQGTSASTAGTVQQSRLNDINPDDIESMQVLKGASAAALYGARALNGVILITTKSGKANKKGFTVTLGSSVSLDFLNRKVPLQEAYGGGNNGLFQFVPTGGRSWGDRIADRPGGTDNFITDPNAAGYQGRFVANDGKTYYAIANGTDAQPYGGKNDRTTYSLWDNLFQTGVIWNNSVSISSADQKGNFYMSFSDNRIDGIIIGNSSNRRTTGRLNATRYLGKLFTVSARATYAKTAGNRTQRGSNLSGIFLGGLRTPADYDIRGYTGTYFNAGGTPFTGRQRAYRNPLGAGTFSIYDNPLWITNNILNETDVDRFLGTLEFGADPLPWLNITWRTGVDFFSDLRSDFFPTLSSTNSGGAYNLSNFRNTQFNSDLIARASFKATDNISGTVLVGIGANERRGQTNFNQVTSFVNPLSPPQLANSGATARNPTSNFSVIRNVGYYAQANIGFYDMVFLNAGGRYEEWSTMNKGFFFPSVDVAFQFSKLLPKNDIFTFGKLRGAWGQVGNAAGAYADQAPFFDNAIIGDAGWGSNLDPAAYGGGSRQSNTAPAVLEPEIKTEFEVGVDARFFKDRLSVSYTYYNNNTTNLIQAINVAPSTGFLARSANAATIENRGQEFEISGVAVKTGDFSLSINANYFRNINLVKTLVGTEQIFLGGFTGTSSAAVQGYQLGTIWGTRWDKNDNGTLILDADGFPQQAATPFAIGDPNPEYRVGLGFTARYKNFSLNVLVDHSAGGEIWNGTKGALYFFGRHGDQDHTITLTAAEAASLKTWLGLTVDEMITSGRYPSANRNADGSVRFRGKKADFGGGTVLLDEYWYRSGPGSGFTGPSEQFIEDATWTRLREVSLSYTLNSKGFQSATGLQNIVFTATGRNLFLWTDYDGIDPDTNLTGAGLNAIGLDYFNNPATRSFLFSIKITY
ncbi:hypothetical protein BKI52_29205 [marine bacterium AO1-C]|nr:hypothetical protein BKI52_29205 [marine bacterium AO1-C]